MTISADQISANGLDLIPWYKQFWPWFLFSLPAIIVVAGIAMIIMALNSPFALVEDDYYKHGLGINQNLAAQELAAELGVSAELSLNDNVILVDLNTASVEQLELRFIHPTDASKDQTLQLQKLGERRFEGLFNASIKSGTNKKYQIKLVGLSLDGQWLLASELMLDNNASATTRISLGQAGSLSND